MWWSERRAARQAGSCAAAACARRFGRVGLLVLAASCVLTACGFRLQGATLLPAGVESVYLALDDEVSPFGIELRRRFESVGAEIAVIPPEADVVVRVLRERTGRRVLSVSARNTPKEYELFYTIEFSIDRDGTEVVPRQELSLTRIISFDETQLLAKDREERILRDALARDLADLVLRRVEAL